MLAINSVFDAPAYRWVQSEEGPYEFCCGLNVFASRTDSEGLVHTYLYVGPEGGTAAHSFDHKAADRFAARVRAAGRITPAYWFCVETRDPRELPDYVLHPERPEYN